MSIRRGAVLGKAKFLPGSSLGAGGFPQVAVSRGFVPTDIAGSMLWLEADNISGADNDPITTWTDQSSAGRNATQNTAAKKPTLKTNIQNGKPIARFDGVDDEMILASSITGTVHTAFFVLSFDATFNDLVLAGAGGNYFYYQDATNRYYSAAGNAGNVAHTPTADTVLLDMVRRDGTNLKFFKNAAQLGADATLAANSANDVSVIGNYTTGGFPFAGDIAAIIVYDSALSVSDRQRVETYLNDKYAIY